MKRKFLLYAPQDHAGGAAMDSCTVADTNFTGFHLSDLLTFPEDHLPAYTEYIMCFYEKQIRQVVKF